MGGRTGTSRRAALRCSGATFLLLLLILPLFEALAAEPPDPRIISFTPAGVVKRVRQVTARFSEPMVPLGDPRVTKSPFEITCPEPGTARWMDSRNWVYDFARDLPAGTRCSFQVAAGLISLAGKPLTGQREFAFSTGGPAIRFSVPREGNEAISEDQAFLLVLDAEPTEDSLLRHVAFSIQGIAERVGVNLLTGKARDEIVKAQFARSVPPHLVVLQARQQFPNGARVDLVWGQGVETPSGVATAQDQVLPFRTRPPFTARFSCERENRQAGCIPVTPMTVAFSAPVAWELASRVVLAGPGGRHWTPKPRAEETPFVQSVLFEGPFPEEASFQVQVPPGMKDDAGRPLANASQFPLAVRTEAFPPLAKFSARFGIVEWKADPTLPVTLRNLEPQVKARLLRVDKDAPSGVSGTLQDLLGRVKGKIFRVPPARSKELLPWLRKVAGARRDSSVFTPAEGTQSPKEFMLPKPLGAKPFEVVGIPLGAPGLYVVELESARLGASLLGGPRSMYVPAAALVTNLAVHFKWGRESSLVWVTTLDSGAPVPGATVRVQDCQGAPLWEGQTDDQGIARPDKLPGPGKVAQCRYFQQSPLAFTDYPQLQALQGLDQGLLVTAQTADDLSFVHSTWTRGIESWRFRLPAESYLAPLAAHTILDRSLFRAGETVHMKHLLRQQTLAGFKGVAEGDRPVTLSIRHLGSDQQYDLPLAWDAAGVAETAWQIPQDAKLGTYRILLLEKPNAQGYRRQVESGTFRVEEFRVALMRGAIRLPAEPQVAVAELPADLSLRYLAGGGAGNYRVTLRTQIRPRWVSPPEAFEQFAFANGALKEGITRGSPGPWEEWEGEGAGEGEEGAPVPPAAAGPAIHSRERLTLDAAGTARATIPRLRRVTTPHEVLAEMEFRDPNGAVRTVSATVPLWPAAWLVGIRPDSWVASRSSLKAQVAVVDVSERPVAGAAVAVSVLERKTYSSRKRLVGGFYAYAHVEEVRRLGELCRGTTDAKGRLFCEGKPPADGDLILQASVMDPAGNASAAHQDVWVAGSEQWWFDVQDDDRMDLLPEKPRYEPGDTARLQVRMPFRQATGLVTIEREGVSEARVVSLSGKEPVIDVPIKGSYAPNIFVSGLAVRGRVTGVQPTALVDLGRPAFKLGVAELRVGWRAHELKVTVSPERPVYHVRQKARVRLAVRKADGSPLPPGGEVAVAAVDEGLLDLAPNRSWNLLEAMMRRRGYGVQTATAQMQVVGKRHYGLKALPQGGGGGRQVTRELFDTLLFWRGRVPLDPRGEAVVEIPLNDSLTSFRIVAVATSGVDLFGTGEAAIRSTQDLMVLAGLPPLVREGDRYESEFTVRNLTGRPMEARVGGRVEGLAALEPQTVSLAPGEAKVVGWPIQVPAGHRALQYDVQAEEPGGAQDHLRLTQEVREAVPVRTYQATLSRWERPLRQPVARPADALPGRGGVRVAVAATLAGGLAGVKDYMSRYPYTCLEQLVSQAVALRDEGRWKSLAARLPAYLDSDGLLKYFPQMLLGSDVLTAYVLAVIHESGWTLPPEVLQRTETGLRRFVEGSLLRGSALLTADLSLRKLAALEALSRYGQAEPRLLGSITIEPNLWPTSGLLDWWNLLARLPGIPGREARSREVEQILRARLNLQGTTMGFSTEGADGLWWLMVSPDVNAVRLILHLLEAGEWRDDLPRILRGALARQRRGAWDLTVANAWGALAVEKFSRAFEKTPPSGLTTAALHGVTASLDWRQAPQGKTLSFPWPPAGEELLVDHEGGGNPWVTVETRAAIPLETALGSGYRITRSVTPIEQRQPGRWSRGDLMRVRLRIEAQGDMTWVVVSDPIPAGASHLGSGLGGDSQLAVQGERLTGWAYPAFEERSFEAYRAYYEYVPKGTFSLEYTIRLNQSGRFQLPSTRVEALYAPEMFGELPNAVLEVLP